MRLWVILSVTVPALTLAAVGFSHPHALTPESAQWWTTMHILLLPIFPLLGVAQWVLVRGPGMLAWGARLAAFGYAVFYGALDAIAGIGTGTLVQNGVHAGGGHGIDTTEQAPEIGWLFGAGNQLGTIGTWSFLVGSVLTAVVVFQRHGRMALPGGIVLIAASVQFLSSHIYWPTGVFTMLAMAVGFGLLAAAERRPTRVVPTGDSRSAHNEPHIHTDYFRRTAESIFSGSRRRASAARPAALRLLAASGRHRFVR